MAFDTYLMEQTQVVARTGLSAHLNPSWWRGLMRPTQEQFIRPILGADLYEELQTQIETNTVTVANQMLLDRVYDALAWRVRARVLVMNTSRVENVGNQVNKTEHGDAAAAAEVTRQIMEANNIADTLTQSFACWLEDNKDSYPLYKPTARVQSEGVRNRMFDSVRKDHPSPTESCNNC